LKERHPEEEGDMDTELFADLKRAILEYDVELAIRAAKATVEAKVDPLKAIDAMTEAIRRVGDGFGAGELYLPDLVGAAEAMSKAMPILQEELRRCGTERESEGTVVIGTVHGDIHSIGKTMVVSLLTAEGFEVHDLGVNVACQDFAKAVREYNANLLAMSALLTTSASEQSKTIELLKSQGLRDRVKVLVGGAAITPEFADKIGADGYEPTAPLAVKLARSLIGK